MGRPWTCRGLNRHRANSRSNPLFNFSLWFGTEDFKGNALKYVHATERMAGNIAEIVVWVALEHHWHI